MRNECELALVGSKPTAGGKSRRTTWFQDLNSNLVVTVKSPFKLRERVLCYVVLIKDCFNAWLLPGARELSFKSSMPVELAVMG